MTRPGALFLPVIADPVGEPLPHCPDPTPSQGPLLSPVPAAFVSLTFIVTQGVSLTASTLQMRKCRHRTDERVASNLPGASSKNQAPGQDLPTKGPAQGAAHIPATRPRGGSVLFRSVLGSPPASGVTPRAPLISPFTWLPRGRNSEQKLSGFGSRPNSNPVKTQRIRLEGRPSQVSAALMLL